MSLSPVSAISDMVAPVVLMTLATIFANGLLAVAAAAVTVASEGLAYTALVMAGVTALFAGIVFVIGSAARLGDIVTQATRHIGMTG